MNQPNWRPLALGVASLAAVIAIALSSSAGRQAPAHPKDTKQTAAAASPAGPAITPGQARAEADTLDLQLD